MVNTASRRRAALYAAITILLTVVECWPTAVLAQYYVSQGGVAKFINARPPDNIAQGFVFQHWSAYFYPKGASATGLIRDAWGSAEAGSIGALSAKIRAAQKLEKTWETWCGCEWGRSTFFNVLSPVLVENEGPPGDPTTSYSSPLSRAFVTVAMEEKKVEALVDQFNVAANLAGEQKIKLFGDGSPVSDFIRSVRTAIERFSEIQKEIEHPANVGMANINTALDDFGRSVSEADRVSAQAVAAMTSSRGTPDQGQPGPAGGSFFWADGAPAIQSVIDDGSKITLREPEVQDDGTRDTVTLIAKYRDIYSEPPAEGGPNFWYVTIGCGGGMENTDCIEEWNQDEGQSPVKLSGRNDTAVYFGSKSAAQYFYMRHRPK